MASKPEATFVRSVNKHVPQEVHHEGNADQFSGGRPDRRYEGCQARTPDLWIEYKFLSTIPPVIDMMDIKKQVKLSGLQQDWLKRANEHGRNVAVIIGCKQGGVILTNMTWTSAIPRDIFLKLVKSRKQIAEWITDQVR